MAVLEMFDNIERKPDATHRPNRCRHVEIRRRSITENIRVVMENGPISAIHGFCNLFPIRKTIL